MSRGSEFEPNTAGTTPQSQAGIRSRPDEYQASVFGLVPETAVRRRSRSTVTRTWGRSPPVSGSSLW